MDPLIGSSLIGGAANLIGGALGLSGQDSANKQNLEIARMNRDMQRETNRQQLEMFERQLAENRWYYNNTNEYNSPSAQVQRLKNAGINPAFVMGNNSTAEASSLSAPAAPSLTAPAVNAQVQPLDYSFIGNGAFTAVNAFYQNRLLDAQKDKTLNDSSLSAANAFRTWQGNPSYLRSLENQANKTGFEGDLARSELAYIQAVNGQRISQMFNDTRMQEKQMKIADEQYNQLIVNNALAQIEKLYAPRIKQEELNNLRKTGQQISAVIALTNANAMLTNEQRLHEIEKKVGSIIDNELKGLDRDIKRDTKSYIIGMARENLYTAEDARFERPWNFYRNMMGNNPIAVPSFGTGVDMYHQINARRQRFGYNPYNYHNVTNRR